MKTAAFLRGMGTGLAAGAAAGALYMSRQGVMKTDVGRAMKKMGNAIDAAWYDMKHTMR